jgi:hypothetical protein
MTAPQQHGVPAADLDDEAVRREMTHLHQTRHDVVLGGSEDALNTHTARMLELEQEYLRRFADEGSPDPLRTRAGSRAADGRG